MLIFWLVMWCLGGVIVLGLLLHLAWFWVTGQDYRTPAERAWEEQMQLPPNLSPQMVLPSSIVHPHSDTATRW
jgi:hypothetical protein